MRFKLNFLLFFLLTLVLILSSVFSYSSLRDQLNSDYQARKQELTNRLQMSLVLALWNRDNKTIADLVSAELASPDVASIRVYETGYDQVGEAEGAPDGQSDAKLVWADRASNKEVVGDLVEEQRLPLRWRAGKAPSLQGEADGLELGFAQIVFTRQHVEHLLAAQIRHRVFEIVMLNLCLGLVLFVVMSRVVIAPLAALSHAFKALAMNPQAGMLELKGEDEFGEVVEAFNQIERRLMSDIERRIEAEKSLRQTNEELTHALESLKSAQESLVASDKFAALGSLVAGVAHEINTPVGVAVTGASFILEETKRIEKALNAGGVKKSEILQFIASIAEGAVLVQSNAERAAHLVQSFKQVAVDEISEQRRDIDLNTYLGEVLTSLRPKYKNTRIKVGYTCPEGLAMDTYPGLLAQVMTNLITNALVHGFDEGAEGEIAIRAWVEDGDWVNIECANSGKTIPSEDMNKIFEPFFTTRRSTGGTGLGLNIVFNIVTQKLGGSITVTSKPGEDTKFTVRVPRISGDKANDRRQK